MDTKRSEQHVAVFGNMEAILRLLPLPALYTLYVREIEVDRIGYQLVASAGTLDGALGAAAAALEVTVPVAKDMLAKGELVLYWTEAVGG